MRRTICVGVIVLATDTCRSAANKKARQQAFHHQQSRLHSQFLYGVAHPGNFTEAGQERNIKVGLSIQSKWLAKWLIRHFKLLREHGLEELYL